MAIGTYHLKNGTSVDLDTTSVVGGLVEELLVDITRLRNQLDAAKKLHPVHIEQKRNSDRYEWRKRHEMPKLNIKMVVTNDIEGQEAVKEVAIPMPSWEELDRYIDQDIALIRQRKLD